MHLNRFARGTVIRPASGHPSAARMARVSSPSGRRRSLQQIDRKGKAKVRRCSRFSRRSSESWSGLVFLRWLDDQGNSEKASAYADERSALTGELTLLFGPIIRLLVEAEIASVHVGQNDAFSEIMAPVNNVAVDDQFRITLDCEPNDQDTVDWQK
jgi:hypothetical protein